MLLSDHFYLTYIDISDLLTWIKTNQLTQKNFQTEKSKWKSEVEKEPNFFSDTELLLLDGENLLLKALDQQQAAFLAQTYRLEQQVFCQEIFGGTKNIILFDEKQWAFFEKGEQIQPEKAIVLLKDETSIEKSFANWLAKKK